MRLTRSRYGFAVVSGFPDETQFYRWGRRGLNYQIHAPCQRCFGRLEVSVSIDKLRSYVPLCTMWPVLADECFDEPPSRASRIQLDLKYAALTVSHYLKYERVQNPERPLPPLQKTALAHLRERLRVRFGRSPSLRVVGGGEVLHRLRQCKRRAVVSRIVTHKAFCVTHFTQYSRRDHLYLEGQQ